MAVRRISPGIWGLVKNLVALVNQLAARTADCTFNEAGLGIHSNAAQMTTTAGLDYRCKGCQFNKVATTGITFSHAHVITQNKYGAILIQINAAGNFSTKVKAATQTTALAYDTAALAAANLPEVDASNVAIGHAVIAPTAGTFTANTTELTSICTYTNYLSAREADADSIQYRGQGTPS